ncbi:MAG TPA: ATP-binding protein, partial [Saprospiraceae bacterium]|nr:ATP-binding protein [Saprospiraceae bacterium]
MSREGLPIELKKAIELARAGDQSIRKEGILLERGKRKIAVEVIPLRNTIEPYFLILFEDQPHILKPKRKNADTNAIEDAGKSEESKESRVKYLENELSELREDMRTIIEDNESSSEELQSANEELLSSSEELQSLNEELETSKEEIESTNEELITLNQELTEINEHLQSLQRYTQAIITTIHEPVVVLTSDFKLKSANKAYYEVFGLTEIQTEGKIFFEINGGIWDVADLKDKLYKILPEHRAFENFEMKVQLNDGTPQIFLLNARQIINHAANEQLILLAIQDITSQKEFQYALEAEVQTRTWELREVNVSLVQSNENLRQFASIASHDLQEPLRKIKTFTTLLDQQIGVIVPDEGKELISKIRISAERMSLLIKELIQYSKVTESTKKFSPTDMDEILKNVLNDLELLISETGTNIQYHYKWPVIEAIPLQMHQLIYNLLINAIKFQNPETRPEIKLDFKIMSEDDVHLKPELTSELQHIEIIISDNGIGFAQQFSDQIFDLFERLPTTQQISGSGMGLALCKKIIENHHGYIYAVSKEQIGSSFHIIMPTKQY